MLPQLARSQELSPNMGIFERDNLKVVLSESLTLQDVESLKQLTDTHVAIFSPISWYILRDENNQNWDVMDPKKKQEETLYSTIAFFHPANDTIKALLDLAQEREWAVYAFDSEQTFCLVLNTGVVFSVNRDDLLGHVKGEKASES